MLKTFDIKLDVEKDLYSPMQILFNVSNNDIESVQLNFEILQDENPFDLTGKTIQMAIQSPSRKVVYVGIEIQEPVQGKASARLSQGAYLEEGIHVSEVYITDVDQTIVTSPFYFNSWQSITAQETVPTDPTTGDVYWQNVLNKPLTFPPNSHTHPMEQVVGLLDALDGKANVGETGGGVPEDHTHEIADVNGLQSALDGKVDDAQLTTKSDVGHTHGINEVTGLQNALDGKVDDAQLDTKANLIHAHAIQDITGLQNALDGKASVNDLAGKMDDGDAYLKTETYSKAEVYNKTEINQMTMGEGGGEPVIVEDNLASTSPTNALSSNQGRILNQTKSDVNHNHTSANITDFTSAVADAIPLEYMTQSEGDGRYQAIGTVPAHTHDEYLTPTEADALYQPIDTVPVHDHPEYLTSDEADAIFLTPTEGDGRYQAIGTVPVHDHPEYLTSDEADALFLTPAEADASFLTPTEADAMFLTPAEGDTRYQASGTIPTHDHPEYLTDTEADALFLTPAEGDTRYQASGTVPTHTHTVANITDFPTEMTPKLMQSGVRGGARVGNGLGMSGEYLTVKSGAGLVTSATTYQVEVDRATTDGWYVKNATGQGLTIWKGTQAAYDGLTKDPNTLYFIVG